MTKLTDEQVIELRKLYKAGCSITFEHWAQVYGVTERQIWNVVHGFSFKHLEEIPAHHGRINNPKPKKEKLTRAQKFWRYVDIKKKNECWRWKGYKTQAGYGSFRSSRISSGLGNLAHRVAYFLVNGAITAGMFVCHKCDNPACCNPNHLFLGTPADNMHDRDAKGRNNKGKKLGMQSNKKDSILETLRLTLEGKSGDEIAQLQGIGRSTVYQRRAKYRDFKPESIVPIM